MMLWDLWILWTAQKSGPDDWLLNSDEIIQVIDSTFYVKIWFYVAWSESV